MPAVAGPVPIVMLTALGEEDRILGLEMGSDDYIAKLFSPRELVLRVSSVLRRARSLRRSGHRAGADLAAGGPRPGPRGRVGAARTGRLGQP
ncbi:MAG: hypothetical protein JO063_04680 [Pseudonocardiales bacterium]|nr:hypothetical protein [Pseudonocardiales bacterium]MBV9030236.1 hypothetical protein [Pseudonocardiales bacterium]MBW0009405.1 hypothetical protein [Pseudonocardiales bacterium]